MREKCLCTESLGFQTGRKCLVSEGGGGGMGGWRWAVSGGRGGGIVGAGEGRGSSGNLGVLGRV